MFSDKLVCVIENVVDVCVQYMCVHVCTCVQYIVQCVCRYIVQCVCESVLMKTVGRFGLPHLTRGGVGGVEG